MSNHAELRLALGSYLVGALSPAERLELEVHLRDCPACSNELSDLSGLPGLLGRLTPEEAQWDFPPPPDNLLADLLARAHVIEIAQRHRLHRWQGAGAVLAVAAAVLIGILVVPLANTSPTSYPLRAALASAPSSGEATLLAKTWGTQLTLTMNNLPSDTNCIAVVTGVGGRVEIIGSWGSTPSHAAEVTLATDISTLLLRTITVETSAGKRLMTARLRV